MPNFSIGLKFLKFYLKQIKKKLILFFSTQSVFANCFQATYDCSNYQNLQAQNKQGYGEKKKAPLSEVIKI